MGNNPKTSITTAIIVIGFLYVFIAQLTINGAIMFPT